MLPLFSPSFSRRVGWCDILLSPFSILFLYSCLFPALMESFDPASDVVVLSPPTLSSHPSSSPSPPSPPTPSTSHSSHVEMEAETEAETQVETPHSLPSVDLFPLPLISSLPSIPLRLSSPVPLPQTPHLSNPPHSPSLPSSLSPSPSLPAPLNSTEAQETSGESEVRPPSEQVSEESTKEELIVPASPLPSDVDVIEDLQPGAVAVAEAAAGAGAESVIATGEEGIPFPLPAEVTEVLPLPVSTPLPQPPSPVSTPSSVDLSSSTSTLPMVDEGEEVRPTAVDAEDSRARHEELYDDDASQLPPPNCALEHREDIEEGENKKENESHTEMEATVGEAMEVEPPHGQLEPHPPMEHPLIGQAETEAVVSQNMESASVVAEEQTATSAAISDFPSTPSSLITPPMSAVLEKEDIRAEELVTLPPSSKDVAEESMAAPALPAEPPQSPILSSSKGSEREGSAEAKGEKEEEGAEEMRVEELHHVHSDADTEEDSDDEESDVNFSSLKTSTPSISVTSAPQWIPPAPQEDLSPAPMTSFQDVSEVAVAEAEVSGGDGLVGDKASGPTTVESGSPTASEVALADSFLSQSSHTLSPMDADEAMTRPSDSSHTVNLSSSPIDPTPTPPQKPSDTADVVDGQPHDDRLIIAEEMEKKAEEQQSGGVDEADDKGEEEMKESDEGEKLVENEDREEEVSEFSQSQPSQPSARAAFSAVAQAVPGSPIFGMTQQDDSEDEDVEEEQPRSADEEEEEEEDEVKDDDSFSLSITSVADPPIREGADESQSVGSRQAGKRVREDEVSDAQPQHWPPSQQSVLSTSSKDFDAFMLDDEDKTEDRQQRLQSLKTSLSQSKRAKAAEEEEETEAPTHVAAVAAEDEEDVAMDDEEEASVGGVNDSDDNRPYPSSPVITSPTHSATPPRSPSPMFSQRDVDALHTHIAVLQAKVSEQALSLSRQLEVDEMVKIMQLEADEERLAQVEQKQQSIDQLQVEKADLESQLREAMSARMKREGALHLEQQAMQTRMDAVVEELRLREAEFSSVRTDMVKVSDQSAMQVRAQQSAEQEMGELRRRIEQRESELAQLTSTPLAHRVDSLQQQVAAAVKERDEAVKRLGEAESRAKAVKKEAKEQRKESDKERETSAGRVQDLNSALQELGLKHSELTARYSASEEAKRGLTEQLKQAQVELKEQAVALRELTRLQVKEEVHLSEISSLKLSAEREASRVAQERKEARDEMKAQRDDIRSLNERLREVNEVNSQQKAALQSQVDQVKASLASSTEKITTLTERCANLKSQAEGAQKELTKKTAELERLKVVGEGLEENYKALDNAHSQAQAALVAHQQQVKGLLHEVNTPPLQPLSTPQPSFPRDYDSFLCCSHSHLRVVPLAVCECREMAC